MFVTGKAKVTLTLRSKDQAVGRHPLWLCFAVRVRVVFEGQ